MLVTAGVFGFLGSIDAPPRNGTAPTDAESTQVSELLATFPNADQQAVVLVATRDDGAVFEAADLAALGQLRTSLAPVASGPISEPTVSEDQQAAVLAMPITVGESNSDTATTIKALRADIKDQAKVDPGLAALDIQVTGGPAFGADIASSFDGADITLLAVTVGIVAILLIATYRSPVLWLVPLIVVAVADQLAAIVTTAVASVAELQFEAGIVSVLVFGAGTNYALLLISRYREELRHHENHREAMSTAWSKTLGAIVASNATVVLSLLTFTLAVIPSTHGLGIAAAVGLVIAAIAVLFVLPAVLVVCGRGIFWPFVPRPGDATETGALWRNIANTVLAKPARSLAAGLALLAVMAVGLFGTSVGLDQVDRFRVQSESASGLETLAQHFPAGEAEPIMVVANSSATKAVLGSIQGESGVVRAHPAGANEDGTLTKIMVTSAYEPGSKASLDQIESLRETVHAVDGAEAKVGGSVATDYDARVGNQRDLLLIAPLVLAVCFVVLIVLLRSLVAPVLLLVINLTSAIAAIGAGAWLSRVLFDQPALDLQVPLLAFLFLVALGIDYTIFLMHRVKDEAPALGTRAAMAESLGHTGSVITSAGIVLAAVFAALGLLPLVTLGQLGLIVGVGVLVDTLVVRTVIVPALFGLIGDAIWWPRKPATENHGSGDGHLNHEPRRSTLAAR